METNHTIRKYKSLFTRLTLIFSGLLCIPISIYNAIVISTFGVTSIILLMCGVIFLCSALFFSKADNYYIGAAIAVLLAMLVVSVLVVRAPYPDMVGANSYIPIIIAAATLLVGIRFGAAITVLILVLIFLSSQAQLLGYEPQYSTVAKTIFYDRYMIALLSFFIAAISEKTTEAALATIKRQEEELRINEKLVAMGVFVGGVAHEIKNPLTILSGTIFRIEKITKEHHCYPLLEDKLYAAKQSIRRIDNIIESLLIIGRTDIAYKSQERCQLSSALAEALEMLAPKIRHVQARILNLGDENIWVYAGSYYLSTVLRILIDNSLDALQQAAQPNPTISIKTEITDKFLKVQVIDNGPGIPKEIQDKIFDPFFTTKEHGKGSGIGLSLGLAICQALGWQLKVETYQKGATFALIIDKYCQGCSQNQSAFAPKSQQVTES